jgi:hypothetical protein
MAAAVSVPRAIGAREQSRILTALRCTTMRVSEIAAATKRMPRTIERIAQANHIPLKGRM